MNIARKTDRYFKAIYSKKAGAKRVADKAYRSIRRKEKLGEVRAIRKGLGKG